MFWFYGVAVAALCVGVSYFLLRKPQVAWGFAPMLFFYLIFGFTGPKSVTTDYEYLTWWADEVGYKEDEWRLETYTETSTDSKGRSHSTTKTRWVYDWPEYWIKGGRVRESINRERYLNTAHVWGHTPSTSTLTGRTHKYGWNGEKGVGVVLTRTYHFENKPANSPSVWKYPEIKNDILDLTEWKDVAYQKRWLNELNADFGPAYQVRVNLIFSNSPDIDVGMRQEIYWKGGKKNELNICVGIVGGLVQWCHVFSWSESEGLKTAIEYHIMNFGLDRLEALLREKIPTEWKRKQFADFNYIDIPHPLWCYWGFAVLCVISDGVTCFIIIKTKVV